MRAAVITRPGGPEVLEIQERPTPKPANNEVLIRVRASALNRADLLQRQGQYPAPPGSPADIPGMEYAGEIASHFDVHTGSRFELQPATLHATSTFTSSMNTPG